MKALCKFYAEYLLQQFQRFEGMVGGYCWDGCDVKECKHHGSHWKRENEEPVFAMNKFGNGIESDDGQQQGD